MGAFFSKNRRTHELPPHPEPPSSEPIPSVSLPPPQPPRRPSSPPPPPPSPPPPQRPPAPSAQPQPQPPPAYPYAAPPPQAPYYPYPQRPSYVPYGPPPQSSGSYSYPSPYGCQPTGPPHYSHFPGYYDNRWSIPPAAGPSTAAPPPYVEHKTAKKIKNDVNVHKDTIKLFFDEQNPDSHLVSFTFDALVDGSITVFYFAKEGANCTFSPMYPDIYTPQKIPFQKGLSQKFCQPSGSGIDLGFFDADELSKASQGEDIFPLVIYAEASAPSLIDEQPDQPISRMSAHAQITEAVLVKGNDDNLQVRVIKQILWVEGVRYELREIYGMSNADEKGFEDSDPGKECVICMTEPKDTAVLPCRHMCMCGECAKELRLQTNKCPICRQPIEELLEIKVNNNTSSRDENDPCNMAK